MKNLLSTLILATVSLASHAGDITTAATYVGPTQGIGVGFFDHVGVGLPAGQTCHGANVAVLLTTNTKYKEILSTLLLAEATKQPVTIYQLGAQTTTFAGTYIYCVVTQASLNTFPLWPAQ